MKLKEVLARIPTTARVQYALDSLTPVRPCTIIPNVVMYGPYGWPVWSYDEIRNANVIEIDPLDWRSIRLTLGLKLHVVEYTGPTRWGLVHGKKYEVLAYWQDFITVRDSNGHKFIIDGDQWDVPDPMPWEL